MTEEYELDIVVPTHNHARLTMGCVDYLYAHTANKFHLIIVDDSEDITKQFIKELMRERDNITFIHSDEPYKSGNQIFNIALDNCRTPYLATVMNSIEVEPDWDIMPLKMLTHSQDIGTIGMKCLFAKDGRVECAGIYIYNYLPCDIGKNEPSHRLSEIFQCEATQWAFAMHRVTALEGNLGEDIYNGFVGVDDIDNCFMLRHKGWRVMECGLSVAYHHPRATRGRNDEEGYYRNRENLESFYKRWGYWEDFIKCNPEIPESLNGVKFIDDGKKMLEKELAEKRGKYARSSYTETAG